ncbi:MAG: hypothetical protein JWN33_657 [Candidatus Saccharibacteria bacterium]|nr:hypothetical protein [Candidatus Saccharibacteria bacterium]
MSEQFSFDRHIEDGEPKAVLYDNGPIVRGGLYLIDTERPIGVPHVDDELRSRRVEAYNVASIVVSGEYRYIVREVTGPDQPDIYTVVASVEPEITIGIAPGETTDLGDGRVLITLDIESSKLYIYTENPDPRGKDRLKAHILKEPHIDFADYSTDDPEYT